MRRQAELAVDLTPQRPPGLAQPGWCPSRAHASIMRREGQKNVIRMTDRFLPGCPESLTRHDYTERSTLAFWLLTVAGGQNGARRCGARCLRARTRARARECAPRKHLVDAEPRVFACKTIKLLIRALLVFVPSRILTVPLVYYSICI